ncbi:MAG: preprotein translocase subunit SecE [Candidatus Spechtbacterales bacterium]
MKIIFAIIRFLREVRIEMKRVNWLTKKEVTRFTVIVIAVSVVTSVYLGALDLLFTWALSEFVI